jgi:hypothetical protein
MCWPAPSPVSAKPHELTKRVVCRIRSCVARGAGKDRFGYQIDTGEG